MYDAPPPVAPLSISLTTTDAAATRALGQRLGALLRAGDIVRLEGELGAGKTTLVQGIVAGLESMSRVTSPSFTLVNTYRTPRGLTIYHVDAYRLGAAGSAGQAEQTVDTLGVSDLLDALAEDAVLLVEWSTRLDALLPAEGLHVQIAYGPAADERIFTFSAQGPRAAAIMQGLRG